jgi:hypothetical protein
MEARLLVMAQGAPDLNMGDCKEKVAACRASKKGSGTNGQADSSKTDGPEYTPPTRRSKTSNKCNQISSPAAHYGTGSRPTTSPGTSLTQYFEPRGGANQDLSDAVRLASRVSLKNTYVCSTRPDIGGDGVEETITRGDGIAPRIRLVALKPVGKGTPYPAQDQDVEMNEGNHVGDDDGIGYPTNYYGNDDEEEEEEEEFGHEASGTGTSPAAIEYEEKQTRDDRAAMEAVMNGSINLVQAVAQEIHVSADPLPIRAGEWQSSGAAPQVIAGTFPHPR